MALKTKNSTNSYSTLSTGLVNTLDHLGMALKDTADRENCAGDIFAAARQVRILARKMNILSRFDRQVAQSEFAGVFNDYDYCYGKYADGTPSPIIA
jgi:hypothetical protein